MACRQRLCRLPLLARGQSLRISYSTHSLTTKTLQGLRQTTRVSVRQPSEAAFFSTTSLRNAETMVKVPPMAESISEGTLSSFTKKVGDHVEQDEEIASIETDKIDVQVNAPEAGKILEFLVNEGDNVTVGQEIAKLEAGGGGETGGDKEASAPAKEPAPEEQPTSTDQEPKEKEPKKEEPKEEPKKEAAAPPPPPKEEEKKPSPPKKEEKPAPSPAPKEGKEEPPPKAAPGSRQENRVSVPQ